MASSYCLKLTLALLLGSAVTGCAGFGTANSKEVPGSRIVHSEGRYVTWYKQNPFLDVDFTYKFNSNQIGIVDYVAVAKNTALDKILIKHPPQNWQASTVGRVMEDAYTQLHPVMGSIAQRHGLVAIVSPLNQSMRGHIVTDEVIYAVNERMAYFAKSKPESKTLSGRQGIAVGSVPGSLTQSSFQQNVVGEQPTQRVASNSMNMSANQQESSIAGNRGQIDGASPVSTLNGTYKGIKRVLKPEMETLQSQQSVFIDGGPGGKSFAGAYRTAPQYRQTGRMVEAEEEGYYVFFPDGRVIDKIPEEGVSNRSYEAGTAKEPERFGRYTVDEKILTLKWGGNRKAENHRFEVLPQGFQLDDRVFTRLSGSEMSGVTQTVPQSSLSQKVMGPSLTLEAAYDCTRDTFSVGQNYALMGRNWRRWIFTRAGQIRDQYGTEYQDVSSKRVVRNEITETRDGKYTIEGQMLSVMFNGEGLEKHTFEIPHGTRRIGDKPVLIKVDGMEFKLVGTLETLGYASCSAR